MTEIIPLRRRMIEDMTVRNLSPATQRSYVHAVPRFGRFHGRSPERLGLEEVCTFQVHLVAGGISWPALGGVMFGILAVAAAFLLTRRLQPEHPGASSDMPLPALTNKAAMVEMAELTREESA